MLRQNRIRKGAVKHNNTLTQVANYKARKSGRDQALATEWGNAFQETNAAADQQEIKTSNVATKTTDWSVAASWGEWELINNVEVPTADWAAINPPATGNRIGSKIRVLSIDANFQVAYARDPADLNSVIPRLRVVWFIDRQNNDSATTNPTSVFANPVVANTDNFTNFSAMLNNDNQRRYLILADYVKNFTFIGNGFATLTWVDHFDTDFIMGFETMAAANLSRGGTDQVESNCVYCVAVPVINDGTNPPAGATVFRVASQARIAYVDA